MEVVKNSDLDELSTRFLGLLLDWRERLWTGDTRIHFAGAEQEARPVEGMYTHNHWELFFQNGGVNHFSFPGSSFQLQAGDVAIVPPGVAHAERAESGEAAFDMLVIMPGPDWVTLLQAGAGEGDAPQAREVLSVPITNALELEAGIRCCGRFLASEEQQPTACGMLGALLGEFVRAVNSPRPIGVVEGNDLIGRCQALLRSYFSSVDCNVARLAAELGCSPNYLSTQYRQATGSRLSVELQRLRLERAATLLRETPGRVNEIAAASGFADASYFVSRFRKAYGETPRGYRCTMLGRSSVGYIDSDR